MLTCQLLSHFGVCESAVSITNQYILHNRKNVKDIILSWVIFTLTSSAYSFFVSAEGFTDLCASSLHFDDTKIWKPLFMLFCRQ